MAKTVKKAVREKKSARILKTARHISVPPFNNTSLLLRMSREMRLSWSSAGYLVLEVQESTRRFAAQMAAENG